ncbi:cadherin-related family member 2-like [Halichoeres trimaculatus]|uniref:cadherin-related family member 2-like n=1 Tax=Halichoeres trimaculatus TaxID=147232 RepID=UPI003D9E2128
MGEFSRANTRPEITVLTYRVCKDIPIGEVAFTIAATDGENDPLTFSVSGINTYFEVERNTGRSGESMTLDVTVSDGLNTDGGGRCHLDETIYSYSVEDGLHFIDVPYEGSIEENSPLGKVVLNVTAESQNTEDGYKITYSIEDASMDGLFAISSDEGIISVFSEIDREEIRDNVTLTVKATESNLNILGVYTNVTTRVQIRIIDVNDNKPEFYKCGLSCVKETHFTVEVYENVGTISINMRVIDLDKTSNTKLTLGGADKDVFSVQPQSNVSGSNIGLDVKQLEKLDYEKTQQMIVEVIATDQYNTSLHSTATLTINIKDVNDNSPKFPQATYTLNVTENANDGTVVANITATDADAPDTENSQIMFSIEESKYSVNFTIDPDTGVLRNSGELDREALDPELDGKIELNITATDKGTPPLSTSVPVTIYVEDVNDERPEFLPTPTVSVKENTTIMEAVGRFTAEDKDTNHSLVYELESIKCRCDGSMKPCSYFIVDPTGEVRVNPEVTVDYEECEQVVLEAQVVDLFTEKGENNSAKPGRMEINIEDINDNIPEFIFSDYVFVVVSETAVKGTSVAGVTATDRDSGVNRQIEFEVTEVQFKDKNNQTINMKLLFEAVTTQQNNVYVGTIQTTEELDVSLKGKYLVTVTATDAGDLSTSTVLEISTAEKSTVVVLEFSSSEEEVMKNLTDIIRELTAATEATAEIVTIRPVADETPRGIRKRKEDKADNADKVRRFSIEIRGDF